MITQLQLLFKDADSIEFIEGIDYWSIGLFESNAQTITNPIGIRNTWMNKYMVTVDDIKKEVFTVEIETVAEIANWNDGESRVLNALVKNPTYDTGEFELIETFESYELAYDYALQHFPVADIEQLVTTHYVQKNDESE